MKKQPLLILFSFFLVFNLSAQARFTFVSNDDCCQTTSKAIVFNKKIVEVDEETVTMAMDDLKLLVNYLSTNLEYPELSRSQSTEGQLVLQFIFDGKIQNIKIAESLNQECDEMILKEIEGYAMDWNKKSKHKIPLMTVNMPIKFSLGL